MKLNPYLEGLSNTQVSDSPRPKSLGSILEKYAENSSATSTKTNLETGYRSSTHQMTPSPKVERDNYNRVSKITNLFGSVIEFRYEDPNQYFRPTKILGGAEVIVWNGREYLKASSGEVFASDICVNQYDGSLGIRWKHKQTTILRSSGSMEYTACGESKALL